jgi:hypothetical protein
MFPELTAILDELEIFGLSPLHRDLAKTMLEEFASEVESAAYNDGFDSGYSEGQYDIE